MDGANEHFTCPWIVNSINDVQLDETNSFNSVRSKTKIGKNMIVFHVEYDSSTFFQVN